MRKLLFILMSLPLYCMAQKTEHGFTYVRVGYKDLIDKRYEKIVGKKYIDWHDGSEPGMYYKVFYDFGSHPPEWNELIAYPMRQTGHIRDWSIKLKRLDYEDGDWGYAKYLVTQQNKRATFYNKKYQDTLYVSWGDKFSVELRTKGWNKSNRIIFDVDSLGGGATFLELNTDTTKKPNHF